MWLLAESTPPDVGAEMQAAIEAVVASAVDEVILLVTTNIPFVMGVLLAWSVLKVGRRLLTGFWTDGAHDKWASDMNYYQEQKDRKQQRALGL